MKGAKLTVREHTSGQVDFAGVIISLRSAMTTGSVVVVGYPGLPNVERKMSNGDAVLFETVSNGTIEIRVMAMNSVQAEFLVTQISPKMGLLAGAVTTDPNNSPFSEMELQRVGESLASLKIAVKKGNYLAAEQFDLLTRKLDEIQAAATRMGRKDWITYVAGSLTSLCIAAAFAPDVTRKLFLATNEAFTWVFSTGILSLS